MKFRKWLGLIAFLTMLPVGFSAGIAQAQPSASPASAAPRIDGFDVEPARQLATGNELLFTLYGSPGGAATVKIDGATDSFRLHEVEAGVYEGTYTIRSRDRLTADAGATANLRSGNRIATEVLDESLLAGSPSPSATRRAAAAAIAAAPRIDRFEIEPAARLESGAELFFSLSGSPGAQVSVRIAGVKGKLSLAEVATGAYEGTYIIRDRDRISPNSAATATLRLGNAEKTAVLGQSLMAAAGRSPSARRVARHCANCGVVESVNAVDVNGNGGYLGKIAGGVVGAVLGSQVGSGRGTTAAEIAGAVGGAVIGNEIEKRNKKSRHYDVTARLQGGGSQTISYDAEPAFMVGDRVKVENGLFVPAS